MYTDGGDEGVPDSKGGSAFTEVVRTGEGVSKARWGGGGDDSLGFALGCMSLSPPRLQQLATVVNAKHFCHCRTSSIESAFAVTSWTCEQSTPFSCDRKYDRAFRAAIQFFRTRERKQTASDRATLIQPGMSVLAEIMDGL